MREYNGYIGNGATGEKQSIAKSKEHSELWLEGAACLEEGPEFFFPKREDSTDAEEAKTFCRTKCEASIREACLQYALAAGEQHGIWGGLNTKERNRIINRRARHSA